MERLVKKNDRDTRRDLGHSEDEGVKQEGGGQDCRLIYSMAQAQQPKSSLDGSIQGPGGAVDILNEQQAYLL